MTLYTPHKHEDGEIFLGDGITIGTRGFTLEISHPNGFSICGYWANFVLKFKYVKFEENNGRCGGGVYLLKRWQDDEDDLCLIWDGEEMGVTYPSYSRDEMMFELTDDECSVMMQNINEVKNFLQTLKSS